MSATYSIIPRSNPEMRSLYEILLLPQQNRFQDYFLGVIAVLSEYFSIKYLAIFLQDPQKNSLHVEALYGVEKENHPLTCSSQRGMMGRVLESRQPKAIQNLNQEPIYEEMTKAPKRIEKIQPPLLCVPLITDGEPFGLINVNSLYGPRNEFVEDLQFFSILATILSPIIKNYKLIESKFPGKESKPKTKPHLLDEILEERLTEVLNKIDPYVETKAKLGIFDDIIRVVEKILIKSALERVNHVQVAAAQLLGINRNTLHKKIKDLKIKVRND
jgi:transcriptional regulator with GAF, ATPase, and Fis domain